MTPTSPVTLSREEEAERLEWLATDMEYVAREAGWDAAALRVLDSWRDTVRGLLDASRAVTETPEGLDVERLLEAFHREFCSPHGHPAEYDRPIIEKIAAAAAHKEEHGD